MRARDSNQNAKRFDESAAVRAIQPSAPPAGSSQPAAVSIRFIDAIRLGHFWRQACRLMTDRSDTHHCKQLTASVHHSF
jgi:hypothetical protein